MRSSSPPAHYSARDIVGADGALLGHAQERTVGVPLDTFANPDVPTGQVGRDPLAAEMSQRAEDLGLRTDG